MAKDGASFWASGLGHLVIALLVVLASASGGALFLLYTVTHPARDRTVLDPADLLLRTEDVTFQAPDGALLSGWFVKGRPGFPVILLCHDLGRSRSSLMNSAASLNQVGYPLFVFDFRGHGRSGGAGARLGVDERLDILGAIGYLKTRKDVQGGRFGVWGIGMGAYAAALAAVESDEIVALALDSLYPDVPAELDRLVRSRVPPALHFLMPALRALYEPYFMFKLGRFSVARSLDRLAGRNVLFIAALDSPDRYREEKALYAALPENPRGDKNFLELRASFIGGLYAEDKKKYDQAIVGFFSTYLSSKTRPKDSARRPIQVLER
jgi:uncharacterized protein